MKTTNWILIKALVGLTAITSSERSMCQSFVYGNTGVNGAAIAAVYGPDPTNPNHHEWGNTPNGQPPGTQEYGGDLLSGSSYSVEAWYSLAPATDPLQLISGARPVAFSKATFSLAPGYFPGGELTIPEAIINSSNVGYPFFAYLQVRAWDNAEGQLITWDEAWSAALAGSGRGVGWSKVFYQGLTSGLQPYPGMANFESFNIFIVPEPGTVWLSVLGGVALLMVWRRRRQG